jgi:hypothetical protein
MTLRHERAHFDIRKRPMLLSVTGDVPLDVRLLASHETLIVIWEANLSMRVSDLPTLACPRGANVVPWAPLRQLRSGR